MVRCSERQGEWHGSDSELAHEPGEWRDSERGGRPKLSPWPPLRMPRLAVAHARPALSYPGLHDGCREATDGTEQGVQWIQSRTREDEEEEKGITVHTEILYADIAWSWAQDLERRRAWRIENCNGIY